MYEFDVPTDVFMKWEESGSATRFIDRLEGSATDATEWRFSSGVAEELNKYRVNSPR